MTAPAIGPIRNSPPPDWRARRQAIFSRVYKAGKRLLFRKGRRAFARRPRAREPRGGGAQRAARCPAGGGRGGRCGAARAVRRRWPLRGGRGAGSAPLRPENPPRRRWASPPGAGRRGCLAVLGACACPGPRRCRGALSRWGWVTTNRPWHLPRNASRQNPHARQVWAVLCQRAGEGQAVTSRSVSPQGQPRPSAMLRCGAGAQSRTGWSASPWRSSSLGGGLTAALGRGTMAGTLRQRFCGKCLFFGARFHLSTANLFACCYHQLF